jgi:DNA-3-methyladenine glycosylase II
MEITLSGRFDLRQSIGFGFGQRAAGSDEHGKPAVMRLAFVLDGYRQQVGASVEQLSSSWLRVEPVGDGDATAVLAQVARVLSLDVDARGWDELGTLDPLIGRLQAARPGLRPPLFYSAYEALVWAVLSARRPATQMAQVRERLAARHGATLQVAGQASHVVPTPEQLLAVDAFPGLSAEKIRRLHGVAAAALEGRLDTATLRALDPSVAAAHVRGLDGIGPFYSELVVIRALGHTDVLPNNEPRLLDTVGALLGTGRPLTPDELALAAAGWTPWRTWAAVAARAGAAQLSSTVSVGASRA